MFWNTSPATTSLHCFLKAVGYGTLLYIGVRFARFLLQFCRESLWSKTYDFKKYGNWAVITGGSDGIGKALAMELARYGLNIVIISRTQTKLDKVKEEILKNYDVEVVTLSIDVTDDDHVFDVIKDRIEGMEISLLVNNVAVAKIDPLARLLEVQDFEKYSTDAVRANVRTMLRLTGMILPGMVERKGGVIANISTVIAARNSPFLSIYGATKAFVIKYTRAMADEYKSKGVSFQCILPGIVATPPIAKKTPSNFMVPTPEKYAKYLVKALGKSVCTNTSFFWHNVFHQIIGRLPDSLFAKMMEQSSKQAQESNE